jgi:alkylation response protein AidB-like acyl-CoA dehydrogenase
VSVLRVADGATLDSAASMLEPVLGQIAARAPALDAQPRFPAEDFASLRAAGVTQLAADRGRCDLVAEAALIRSVAAADASTARILDGHFNGVERVALLLDDDRLRARELEQVADGALLLGVWGADPAPGEGEPARILRQAGGELALDGVKTFCSGAGGVQRALVVARDERQARRLAYVDVTRGATVDRGWYRASGLRASESHRVRFQRAPVLALLGGDDEIMREPWFARDAVRTSATWAGIADLIVRATVQALAGRPADDLRLHALGRMRLAQSSIDRWLEFAVPALARAAVDVDVGPLHAGEAGEGAAEAAEAGGAAGAAGATEAPGAISAECRLAIADAARTIAAEAARTCGSRALVGGGSLDRARRDLDLFLLQHRLDPKLVELGARTLGDAPR